MEKTRVRALTQALIMGIALLASKATWSDEVAKAQEIVDKAKISFKNFADDPNMGWFRTHIKDSKGVFIVPLLLKAGFIFGGSGGSGVMLSRETSSGKWSNPAFYTMGSATFGLQIGGEAAEVVLLVMTQRGMDAMLSTKFQLGADVSVAAGPVGAGAQAATTDILAFSRTKGVFGGVTVEGAVIVIRNSWNHAYYGKEASPLDILVRRNVHNKHAAALVSTVTKTAKSTE